MLSKTTRDYKQIICASNFNVYLWAWSSVSQSLEIWSELRDLFLFLIRLIVIKKKYIKIREVYFKKYNYSDKTDQRQPIKKAKTKRKLKVKITYYQDK